MLEFSEGLRNGLMVSGSMKSLLDDGFLRIYSGAVPNSPNDSLASAVLLCELSNGGDGVTFESTASNGTLVKSTSEVWNGNNVASGTASFFRFVKAGDSGAASTTAVRVQGTVGVAGADMNLTNPTLTEDAPNTLHHFYLTMPEQ